MKKPDMFEKMVHRPEGWHEHQSMESIEQWAAKLLRAQHRKVVSMVKKELTACKVAAERAESARQMAWLCRQAQCQEILDNLDKLAKGGKTS